MGKKGGGRFDDDDKIIDITDYVDYQSEKDISMDDITSSFADIFNKNIIEKQREEARKRFIHVMINFLLYTQIVVVAAIIFIVAKIY